MPHSVSRFGLGAVIGCSAASVTLGQFSGGIDGPNLPFIGNVSNASSAALGGHSRGAESGFRPKPDLRIKAVANRSCGVSVQRWGQQQVTVVNLLGDLRRCAIGDQNIDF